jgi:hypothetical protein
MLNVNLLDIIMLHSVLLNIIILSVILLNIIMLSVIASIFCLVNGIQQMHQKGCG